MENSKSKIIKEIAQEIDSGSDCYYNFKTHEIIAIPNLSNFWEEDDLEDSFKSQLKIVKKNKADIIKIEVLQSFESFKIMEGFIDQVPDIKFKTELEKILQRRKPFQNFKNAVDNSDFRQKWFDFKILELEKIVEKQISK
ncbi:MAG TPA: UPF0158 family protein [Chitinophagales bacterium]|nr:UPF0158 family protein [Chitinophagales bacterium]